LAVIALLPLDVVDEAGLLVDFTGEIFQVMYDFVNAQFHLDISNFEPHFSKVFTRSKRSDFLVIKVFLCPHTVYSLGRAFTN
jgi:hypothetical protein